MPRKIPQWLRKEEMESIFKVAKKASQRDYMILRTIYFMGLRNSELRKLKDENVDFDNREVILIQAKRKKDRIVTIPKIPGFIKEFESWVSKNKGLIFKSRLGGKISERQIQRMIKKYAIEAGVNKAKTVHPHTLRHSFATYMYSKLGDLKPVQEHLGHERIDTTTIYVHMSKDMLKKKVDEVFEDW